MIFTIILKLLPYYQLGRVVRFLDSVIYAVGLDETDYTKETLHKQHSRIRKSLNPKDESLRLDLKSHNRFVHFATVRNIY